MRKMRILVAAVSLAIALLAAVPAMAQENYAPDIEGERDFQIQPESDVLGSDEAGDEGDVLPFTGGQVITFTLVGLGVVAIGTMLVRRARPQA